jgi:hypothetical protein
MLNLESLFAGVAMISRYSQSHLNACLSLIATHHLVAMTKLTTVSILLQTLIRLSSRDDWFSGSLVAHVFLSAISPDFCSSGLRSVITK